jgi:uncharacterized membrane protein YedE/YeeE
MALEPTPILSLFGGILIGLAAVVLLLANGRLAGISSIFATAATERAGSKHERSWRLAFLAGLLFVGLVGAAVSPDAFTFGIDRSLPALAIAGLLVGYGTRLGGGCTSGHGVCGNARLSPRSLVATVTFIATGAVTVFLIGHLFGGGL